MVDDSTVDSESLCEGAVKPVRRMGMGCFLIACAALTGCTGGKLTRSYTVAVDGNAQRGRELIVSFGCGSCHTIPGIRTARGVIGPPLFFFARRTMIAGELPNSPDNLMRWIENPSAVEPKTAMPALGVTDRQAHDIAAYLYTLQ